MKKNIVCFIVLVLIVLFNISIVNALDIEKGNPSAVYEPDRIILSDGNEVELKENPTLLFLNGTLISKYEVIIRKERALVPIRLIAEELGAAVDWDQRNRSVTISKSQQEVRLSIDSNVALVNGGESNLDYPAIIYNDITYVPLRFVAENLDATVSYSSGAFSEERYYYDTQMPVSPENTLVRNFPNIIIDEKYNFSGSITADEARKNTQKACLEGLENFSKVIRERLISANEEPDRLDDDFERIETAINRMLYIGEVSRFYKFTIGPYDILYDRTNHRIFFIIHGSNTSIKEFDANDPSLYIYTFIVG